MMLRLCAADARGCLSRRGKIPGQPEKSATGLLKGVGGPHMIGVTVHMWGYVRGTLLYSSTHVT